MTQWLPSNMYQRQFGLYVEREIFTHISLIPVPLIFTGGDGEGGKVRHLTSIFDRTRFESSTLFLNKARYMNCNEIILRDDDWPMSCPNVVQFVSRIHKICPEVCDPLKTCGKQWAKSSVTEACIAPITLKFDARDALWVRKARRVITAKMQIIVCFLYSCTAPLIVFCFFSLFNLCCLFCVFLCTSGSISGPRVLLSLILNKIKIKIKMRYHIMSHIIAQYVMYDSWPWSKWRAYLQVVERPMLAACSPRPASETLSSTAELWYPLTPSLPSHWARRSPAAPREWWGKPTDKEG